MSQSMTNFAELSRSFGPGRDLFDAPEEAFHTVMNVIRADLAPASILMFLSVESLIRSLKNQRRPVIHSIHDSRWQRDRASGERMMFRTMNQLIKLAQPAKPNRAAKNPPQIVEPAPVLNPPSPEPTVMPEPVNVEPTEPRPVLNSPIIVNPSVEPVPTIAPPANPRPANAGFAMNDTYPITGLPDPGLSSGETFHQNLKLHEPPGEDGTPNIHET
ncbi:MAG: hypothetical protein ABI353_08300 [Isosphaeraceae bacterium]